LSLLWWYLIINKIISYKSQLVYNINMKRRYYKKPLKMFLRVMHLFFSKGNRTDGLVQKSYDRLSCGYDDSWTNHMRGLTEALIDKMDIKTGQSALDLTCGTGFATGLIAERTGQMDSGRCLRWFVQGSQGIIKTT
jgi:hypothetical protein